MSGRNAHWVYVYYHMPDCKVAGGKGDIDRWGFEVIMGSASQQHLPRTVKHLKLFYTSDGSKSEMRRASQDCRGQPLRSIDENQRHQENVLDLKAREEVAFLEHRCPDSPEPEGLHPTLLPPAPLSSLPSSQCVLTLSVPFTSCGSARTFCCYLPSVSQESYFTLLCF